MRSCDSLRAEFPSFVYESYAYRSPGPGALDCSFRFRTGSITYEPTVRFIFRGPAKQRPVAREVLDNLVFHVGLAEMPSYWKATCSPRVEVHAGALDGDQAAFWRWLLTEGMGEFHFRNQTAFTDADFATVTGGGGSCAQVSGEKLEGGHVIPFGGGKDSLVTLDLLARRTDALHALVINPPPSSEAALELAGVAATVVVERRIDPRLLELNDAGFLNGHTPFGAVVGFASAVAAVLFGRKYVTLSNESSSDHATVRYRGRLINHQAGKSAAFEEKLHRYLAVHVAADLHYFSLLRSHGELAIAQRFSELLHLHGVVRSCNRGRKTDTWCRRCPKCLSTFLVLAPFLEREALVRIFGGDLLADAECRGMLPSLLGEAGVEPPMECVATPAEIRAALALDRGERLGPSSLQVLGERTGSTLVPEALATLIDGALRPRIAPLLRHAAIAVVGFGVEGSSTCRYLARELTIIDDDESVARRLPEHARFVSGAAAASSPPPVDVVFQAPGIPFEHPAIVALCRRPAILTSNTELFFERAPGTIIGVTGTKGKSTATSLIAHVLRTAGRDARLLGNIGTACLDGLEGATSETIHCVELACFQLERLRTSPPIAVVLGIFGDHLDRYRSMADYVAAKSSITRYQTTADLVFHDSDCVRATALAELGAARRVAFGRVRPELLGSAPSPLLGAFNNANLWPAILLGRHFGIADAEIAAALQSFQPLRGRLETVVDKDGIRFVCDIRSTAPEVTVAALDALAGVDFLLLGGVDRKQDYRTLLPALERSRVKHIILFPPTGARIRRLVESSPLAGRFTFFEPRSMEEAIRYVYRWAPATAVCLMSTAAPSRGGLFTGPEDKARQFAHHAAALGR